VLVRKGQFSDVFRSLSDDNHATPWINNAGKVWSVGTSGMLAIAKGIVERLVAQLGTLVRAVVPNGSDWCVQCDDGQLDARHVVKTVPAPQVAGNLGAQHPLVAQIADVEMSPSLTLMAAVSGDAPTVRLGEPNDPLALITHNSS
jgi:renalase